MVSLLYDAYKAGNTAVTRYGEDGNAIENLTLMEVVPDGGVAICMDENGETKEYNVRDCTLLPGGDAESLTIYQVPFAYERYGHIKVLAASVSEAKKKARAALGGMGLAEMEQYSSYLQDSAEIDGDGLVLDEFSNILEE